MKLKEGFVFKKIAEDYVVIPSGNNIVDFNKMIVLNETGAFIWENLEEETTVEKIAEKMTKEFEVDFNTALEDIKNVVFELQSKGLIENEESI